MQISAIITGATGMVGEGVLHECLQHPMVEKVLIINRKSLALEHPKLEQLIHTDFFDLAPLQDRLTGYNACFFCAGVTSVGKSEQEYQHLTYDLTLYFARTLAAVNTDLTFCYISGSGTDSSEQGRMMWARVKGKTENTLSKLPFKKVYNFRPGYMQPTPGLKNTLKYYRYFSWLYPVLRLLFPKHVSTLRELGLAMINSVWKGYSKPILEVTDIVALAKA